MFATSPTRIEGFSVDKGLLSGGSGFHPTVGRSFTTRDDRGMVSAPIGRPQSSGPSHPTPPPLRSINQEADATLFNAHFTAPPRQIRSSPHSVSTERLDFGSVSGSQMIAGLMESNGLDPVGEHVDIALFHSREWREERDSYQHNDDRSRFHQQRGTLDSSYVGLADPSRTHHAGGQSTFMRDVVHALRGEYLTRYPLLTYEESKSMVSSTGSVASSLSTSTSGAHQPLFSSARVDSFIGERAKMREALISAPDPQERFVTIEVEEPSASYKKHVDPGRKFPLIYLTVKVANSRAASFISRFKLCDLVGVTRDVINPCFGPHRVFVDGTIGYDGVLFEDTPRCPDPDTCSRQVQEDYKVKQTRLLGALKEKVIGVQGKRLASTGKHQILHAENAFTLWFFDTTKQEPKQLALCAHSAASANLWVDVMKSIVTINSSRAVPIPVETPFNNHATIGRGAAELNAYLHRSGGASDGNHQQSIPRASLTPAAQSRNREPSSISEFNSPKRNNNNNKIADHKNQDASAALSPIPKEPSDSEGNKMDEASRLKAEREERKIRANEAKLMQRNFSPRQYFVEPNTGQLVGEDGLTANAREFLRRQKPPLPYLFRKARYMVDFQNSQKTLFVF